MGFLYKLQHPLPSRSSDGGPQGTRPPRTGLVECMIECTGEARVGRAGLTSSEVKEAAKQETRAAGPEEPGRGAEDG